MSFGTNTYIDALLDEYIGPEQRGNQLLEDETNTLLYALLLETKALRARQTGDVQDARTIVEIVQEDLDGNAESEGTYHSFSETVSDTSFSSSDPDIDIDWTANEVDIRTTEPIVVAFANPANDENRVEYSSADSPVAGIPVQTSKVWVWKQQGAADADVDIELWRRQA